ncbi:hypothetical protein Tco_1195882, partial [Tanacetum coccineum]
IPSNGNDGNRCMNSFASILKDSTFKKTMKIVELRNNEKVEGAVVAILLDAVDEEGQGTSSRKWPMANSFDANNPEHMDSQC